MRTRGPLTLLLVILASAADAAAADGDGGNMSAEDAVVVEQSQDGTQARGTPRADASYMPSAGADGAPGPTPPHDAAGGTPPPQQQPQPRDQQPPAAALKAAEALYAHLRAAVTPHGTFDRVAEGISTLLSESPRACLRVHDLVTRRGTFWFPLVGGRSLHSSTIQLNLSRVCHIKHSTHPK